MIFYTILVGNETYIVKTQVKLFLINGFDE